MKIAITGRQGHLGTKIAELLKAEEMEVVRIPDVFDPNLAVNVLKGVDAVVDTMSGFKAGGFPRPEWKKIEEQGHKELITACKKAGVNHFIFISVIAAHSAPPSLPHFYYKFKAEELLKQSDMKVTILRPGMFLDQIDRRIEKGLSAGKYECIGSAEVACAVTTTSQVCQAVLSALRQAPSEKVAVIDVLNQNATPRELAEAFSKALAKPVVVKSLPFAVFSAATAIPGLFVPGLKNLKAMMRFVNEGHYCGNPQSLKTIGLKPMPLEALAKSVVVAKR